MPDGEHFYRYSEDGAIVPPSAAAVEAIALLVSVPAAQISSRAATERTGFWLYDIVVPGPLRSVLMGLLKGPLAFEDASQRSEDEPMTGVVADEQYRAAQRHHLELIVSNPGLAANVFPDPDQRSKVLPLMQRLHELEVELEQRLPKSPG